MLWAFFYSEQSRQNTLRQAQFDMIACSLYVLSSEDILRGLSGPDGNDSHHPPC